jgi:hypothetical protein
VLVRVEGKEEALAVLTDLKAQMTEALSGVRTSLLLC